MAVSSASLLHHTIIAPSSSATAASSTRAISLSSPSPHVAAMTSSTLSTSSSNTPISRVERWAVSFRELMGDEVGRQQLLHYLRQEESNEFGQCIRFWLVWVGFKSVLTNPHHDPSESWKFANVTVRMFLPKKRKNGKAPTQRSGGDGSGNGCGTEDSAAAGRLIRLSDRTFCDLEDKWNRFSKQEPKALTVDEIRDLFQDAFYEVEQRLEHSAYPNFIQSDFYIDILNQAKSEEQMQQQVQQAQQQEHRQLQQQLIESQKLEQEIEAQRQKLHQLQLEQQEIQSQRQAQQQFQQQRQVHLQQEILHSRPHAQVLPLPVLQMPSQVPSLIPLSSGFPGPTAITASPVTCLTSGPRPTARTTIPPTAQIQQPQPQQLLLSQPPPPNPYHVSYVPRLPPSANDSEVTSRVSAASASDVDYKVLAKMPIDAREMRRAAHKTRTNIAANSLSHVQHDFNTLPKSLPAPIRASGLSVNAGNSGGGGGRHMGLSAGSGTMNRRTTGAAVDEDSNEEEDEEEKRDMRTCATTNPHYFASIIITKLALIQKDPDRRPVRHVMREALNEVAYRCAATSNFLMMNGGIGGNMGKSSSSGIAVSGSIGSSAAATAAGLMSNGSGSIGSYDADENILEDHLSTLHDWGRTPRDSGRQTPRSGRTSSRRRALKENPAVVTSASGPDGGSGRMHHHSHHHRHHECRVFVP